MPIFFCYVRYYYPDLLANFLSQYLKSLKTSFLNIVLPIYTRKLNQFSGLDFENHTQGLKPWHLHRLCLNPYLFIIFTSIQLITDKLQALKYVASTFDPRTMRYWATGSAWRRTPCRLFLTITFPTSWPWTKHRRCPCRRGFSIEKNSSKNRNFWGTKSCKEIRLLLCPTMKIPSAGEWRSFLFYHYFVVI